MVTVTVSIISTIQNNSKMIMDPLSLPPITLVPDSIHFTNIHYLFLSKQVYLTSTELKLSEGSFCVISQALTHGILTWCSKFLHINILSGWLLWFSLTQLIKIPIIFSVTFYLEFHEDVTDFYQHFPKWNTNAQGLSGICSVNGENQSS